jgi:pyruvate formate lyase activating enzyme
VKTYKIGKNVGLEHIYVGNVAIDTGRDTACPKCGEILIRRRWFEVLENKIKKGKCVACGHKISGRF